MYDLILTKKTLKIASPSCVRAISGQKMYKRTDHWIRDWSRGAVRAALKASARVSKRSIQIDFVSKSFAVNLNILS